MKARLSGQQWPLVQIIGIWKMREFIMNSTWFPIFWGGMKLITVLLSHWDEALWFCDYRCDALRLQLHPDLWSSDGFGRSTLGTETLWTLQHLGHDVPCYRCFFVPQMYLTELVKWMNHKSMNCWVKFRRLFDVDVEKTCFSFKFLISSFEHRRTEGQHSDLG